MFANYGELLGLVEIFQCLLCSFEPGLTGRMRKLNVPLSDHLAGERRVSLPERTDISECFVL